MNQLILGDCLEVMRQMESESIDLIYLDPPFFSNRNYEVIWGDKGEIRSFEDRWSGGIDHYIGWLYDRVAEMHRLLKPTGSIYLHCDWHADAYIRVYILDKLFGIGNFLSAIVWERTFGSGSSKKLSKKYPVNTDTIFCYVKSNSSYTFNQISKPYQEATIKRYDKIDENGKRFKWENLKTYSKETLEKLIANNEAKFNPNSKYPVYKRYFDESIGSPVTNLWNDIEFIGTRSPERIGYPTQKPEKLLERIILASSNEGDVVMDPFVGGGTAVAVADKLGRAWVGIDQSVQAIKVSEMRLNNKQDLFSQPFTVTLHKYDYHTLRYKDAFEFESWIITQFGGLPQNKKGGDKGFDGKMKDGTPIQVKRSDNIGVNVVKNFLSSCQINEPRLFEEKKANGSAIGHIIAFSFGKGTINEAAKIKNEMGIIINLVPVEKIVAIAKKPKLMIEFNDLGTDAKGLHEIEFTAHAETEIEIYAWDWDFEPPQPLMVDEEDGTVYATEPSDGIFKAEVLLDKTGHQINKFKPGIHTIAVKAVDCEGLEAIEVIKLKINGAVVRE